MECIQELLRYDFGNDDIEWGRPHQVLEWLQSLSKVRFKNWTIEEVYRILSESEASLENYKRHKIHVVAQWEESYPIYLKRYDVTPPIIFVKGDLSKLKELHCIALIGAREACSWSNDIQKRLAYIFSDRGYGIVGGLAKGLDTSAHFGCLEAKGTTIAVLAHGFGRMVYPKENYKLAQEIIDKGGCLISTYGWRKPPTRKRFLERNIIQAFLCQGAVFTAASKSGGTAYTIRFMEKLGMPIGYFFHEQQSWSPRGLNDYFFTKDKGFRLSSQTDIDTFLEEIASRRR